MISWWNYSAPRVETVHRRHESDRMLTVPAPRRHYGLPARQNDLSMRPDPSAPKSNRR